MRNSQAFLLCLLLFCAGIALYQTVPYQPKTYLLGIFSGGILMTLLWCLSHNKKTLLAGFFSLAFLFGIFRGQSTLHITTPGTVDYYTSEEKNSITITGTIAEEPDIRRDKVYYTIQTDSILILGEEPATSNQQSDSSPSPISGHLLISTGKYPKYHFGDKLSITGHLQKPAVFDTFDYAGYLSRYNIYAVMYRPRILLTYTSSSSSLSSFLLSSLLHIKGTFESHLNQTFSSEPSSSFMAGLLLGSRKGIPDQLAEDFRITGLTHIIAISGYNITLLVSILMALFRPLGKRLSILISAIGIIVFTLFVGASAAVVRACIMGLIALLALNSERKGSITLTLLMTVTLMIGYNPKILVHDIGFQLSFLATMGLIYVSPLIEPYFRWLPASFAIRESILLTTSAQIMALPVILFNFQALSIVSPLSNLLIAGPIIPLAMLFGFLGTVVSFVYLPLAKLIAFPAFLLLKYIVNIIQLTARIPYASMDVTWFSKSLFWIYFAALTGVLLITWKKRHRIDQRITHHRLEFQHLIIQKIHLTI
ncbi:MAG: ComEC/Rec2 family competence protein [bacterium]|nr:ComEC/Rec2 family competence protein [bacterium]